MPMAAIAHGARRRKQHAAATAKAYDRRRGSSANRGYGATWQNLAKMVLNRDPICCEIACTRAAAEVDHIVPLRSGGKNTMGNLQGLCKTCHSQKTRRENTAS